jgi:peptidyl-prolyl cis-trans isomerase SurA
MRASRVTVAVGILALAGVHTRAELADAITAVVSESVITTYQVQDYAAPITEDLRSRYGNQPEIFRKKLDATLNDSLETLLENRLILHDFDTSEKYRFPDSIVDEQLQAYIRATYGDDRVRFIRTLQAQGKTLEEFRQELRDRLIVQQMRYLHGASEVIVSPHKIEVYYAEHTNQFKVEPEVKLRMIVLNKPAGDTNETRKLAGEILAKLDEGASFTQMASIYSQGSQRTEGGEWGWVEKSVLRKELAEVAFELQPGQRSGVIDTPEACYLMLVEDKRPEHIKPLKEVRDEIERTLMAQESDRAQKQWINRLKQKTYIGYF